MLDDELLETVQSDPKSIERHLAAQQAHWRKAAVRILTGLSGVMTTSNLSLR